MNPVALPHAQSFAHALGWTLLHFCWQGALIALVLACVLALISERAPQPRYFAACTALFLMIAAPIVTFARIIAARPSAQTTFNFIPLETITVNATGTPSLPLLQRMADSLDHSMPALLALWFAGVLFLLTRLTLGLYIARHMKFARVQQPSDELIAAFQSLAHRIGVSRPVRLLHSALVQVPTVIGWLRPVVLIPFGCLTGLSQMQLEAILAHELAHIRRHDYLITVLQTIVEALLFYHPAVWWVSRRIRDEREHCCDDLAVKLGGSPLIYARALSLLAEQSLAQSLAIPATTLGANGGVLTMRIKRLLSPQEGPATSQFAAVTVLALVVVFAGISIGVAAHAQPHYIQPTGTSAALATLISTPTPTTLIAVEPTTSAPLFQQQPQVTASSRSDALLASYAPPQPDPDNAPKAPARVSAAVMAGQVLSPRVNPVYPSEAKANHIEGAVVLHAVISPEGNVTNLQVVSGPKELYQSTIAAVSQWKYKPYLLNGQPIAVETNITVTYSLGNDEDDHTASGAIAKKIGNGVSAPQVVYQVPPEFTQEAKDAAKAGDFKGGKVLVHLIVDEDGNPEKVHVTRGIGYGLDEQAVDAVKQYKFKPAVENDRPVAVALNIEVNFQTF